MDIYSGQSTSSNNAKAKPTKVRKNDNSYLEFGFWQNMLLLGPNWVMQQDNDSKHSSKSTTEKKDQGAAMIQSNS